MSTPATGNSELVITGYRTVGASAVPTWGWRRKALKTSRPLEDEGHDDDRTRGATEIGD